jgi:hypothetical protein
MLFEQMVTVNEKYPIANLNKSSARKSLDEAEFPKWCQRQSDLPTYACIEISKSNGYRPQSQERFRSTNGYLQVTFMDSYWICEPYLTEVYSKTEKGASCLKDFDGMSKNGNVYLNTSNKSSEKRHAVSLAKAASIMYDLAFSEEDDVEAVPIKELQATKRRNEVYKFYGRMRGDLSTPQSEQSLELVAEPPTQTQEIKTMQEEPKEEILEPEEIKDQTQEMGTEEFVPLTTEEKRDRIVKALENGTFRVEDLLDEIETKSHSR